MSSILPHYRALLHQLAGLTAASQARFGAAVQCGSGCALCCHGLFDIGVLDALALHAAWQAAPAAVRDDIEARAAALLARIAHAAPGWRYPYFLDADDDAVDQVLETVGLEACPVLGADQRCRLYEARPFYCRVHGLKLRDRGGDADIDTDCERNFPEPPPRDAWPAFDFSGWFAAEGALISEHGLDPDLRLLIPAVTTARFTPYYTRWTGLR
jgi:Fe-S-cluster containining protein